MDYLNKVKMATRNLEDKIIDYQDWAEIVLGSDYRDYFGDEYLRRAARIFSLYLDRSEDEIVDTSNIGDSAKAELQSILEAKDELIKERKKLQTVNVQAQEYYRTAGRNELMIEQIKEAIAELEPIEVKQYVIDRPEQSIGLLCIADAHYDSNFTVKGLNGQEPINVYDKYIFQDRMWRLLGKMISDDVDMDKLKIVFCGDSLEGLIRASSLTKLRQPVVKSTVEFAEFVSQWLVRVYEELKVPIDVAFVPGNHTVCRYLSQKPEFPEENLEYIIHAIVSIRLEDTDINVEPYDDVYFTQIFNENFIFAHGETKQLESLMNYFENLYGIDIDACYGAHYHSESSKSVGVGSVGSKRVIRVPSMIGTDPFAKKILRNNRAGAYFAAFTEEGEAFNKIYFLN